MTSPSPRILVTGASGQLGRLVIEALAGLVPAASVVAGMRSPAPLFPGVESRALDYDRPETLAAALAGIDRVLLISSNALGARVAQHARLIAAARQAGVKLVAYTSVLHADASPLGLAEEHRRTEADLRASGLDWVVLRNGWYTENHLAGVPGALAHGALIGAAGEGRISAAPRADYAIAAARVMADPAPYLGQALELAGDGSFSLAELAAEISRRAGKQLPYVNLPEAELRAALEGAGWPQEVAALVADSDAHAAEGALFDASGTLGRILGRPTVPMPESLAAALAG